MTTTPPNSPILAFTHEPTPPMPTDEEIEQFLNVLSNHIETEYSVCDYCGCNYLAGKICDCVCTTCFHHPCKCCWRETPPKREPVKVTIVKTSKKSLRDCITTDKQGHKKELKVLA